MVGEKVSASFLVGHKQDYFVNRKGSCAEKLVKFYPSQKIFLRNTSNWHPDSANSQTDELATL